MGKPQWTLPSSSCPGSLNVRSPCSSIFWYIPYSLWHLLLYFSLWCCLLLLPRSEEPRRAEPRQAEWETALGRAFEAAVLAHVRVRGNQLRQLLLLLPISLLMLCLLTAYATAFMCPGVPQECSSPHTAPSQCPLEGCKVVPCLCSCFPGM